MENSKWLEMTELKKESLFPRMLFSTEIPIFLLSYS